VIRHDALFARVHHARFPLEARNDAVDCIVEILHRHVLAVSSGRQQGRLVHDVR